MLGVYGTADDEESILDELARRRLDAGLAEADGTVGDAPTPPIPDAETEASPEPEFALTPLPALSPEELRAAKESDRQDNNRRVVELAAKQAIAGLTRTADPTPQDLASQPGDAEARLRADYGQRLGAARARRGDEVALRRLALQELAQEASVGASGARADAANQRLKLDERRVAVNEGQLARQSAADALKAKYRPPTRAAKTSAAETKAKAAEAKAQRERIEGLAAGFELLPDSNSTKRQREEHAALVTSERKMRGLTQRMRQALQGVDVIDRLNPLSEKRNELKQLATMISLEAKTVADLGALSGPDYALMLAIANDPTSLLSLTRDQTSVLDQLDAWGTNSVLAKSETIGVRPKKAPPTQPAAGGGGDASKAAVPVRQVRRTLPDGTVEEKTLYSDGSVR